MSAVKDPIVVTEDVMTILDWPTDVVSIDYDDGGRPPHTYLIFIPGNPGLVGWYIPALTLILRNIGPGFAIRGISHAGHGITDETVQVEDWHNNSTAGDRNNSNSGNHDGAAAAAATPRNVQIPWTVNGQVLHKMAWIESMPELQLLQSPPQLQPRRLIFLSHSIGAHMVQRLLVLRRDWRSRTLAIVHWMPFLRMEAPTTTQFQLDTVAHHPDYAIGIGQRLVQVTPRWVKEYVLQKHVPDQKGRMLAVNLMEHPTFVRNFLELGTEEIRDLPQLPDISAFRLLSSIPTFILYCSNDTWFPQYHADDISIIDKNIRLEWCPTCKHDFIVYPHMVPIAVDFCVRAIRHVTVSKL